MSETIHERSVRRKVREILLTYGVLLALLGLTMLVGSVDLGWTNVVANLSIATLQALLIMWVFMHLKEMTPFLRLAAAAAVLWFGLLVTMGLGDWMTRGAP
jgi:caa(3)-type oxidase subunit IV